MRHFADLEGALQKLWAERTQRGGRPWAVGWLSYEAAAALAGDLPRRRCADDAVTGCLLLEPQPGPLEQACDEPSCVPSGSLTASLDDAAFRSRVRSILDLIAAGDVYQVNLTRRFRIAPWLNDGAAVLAAVGTPPPDYLARIRGAGIDLVCGSMELLLRRRGDDVETGPIKGTRPRGGTPAEDCRLAAELAADPKETAELAMVVDLERNDLGIVARTGTVRVPDSGSVRSYATVHHRVARVTAAVDPALPWWQIVAAVAPGGSVTGCPKRAAMAIAAGLETTPRGPYTGVLGVITDAGGLELALPIRTAWVARGGLEFGAGCGIVWGSDPAREEAESRLKVARWLELAGSGR